MDPKKREELLGDMRDLVDNLLIESLEDLGYPRDFWIGRNIADFVSVKDRHFFSINEGKLKLKNFCCRFRVYRNLRTGFAVKEKKKKFKFSNISVHEDQMNTESYRFFRVRDESI